MKSFQNYIITSLFIFALIVSSCDEQNPFQRIPYDFSNVPAAFDTTQALQTVEIDQGLRFHIIELMSDSPSDTVTINDRVELFYTGRFTDGEIFDSSYRDGLSRPLSSAVSGFIPGFSFGLVGATTGEKRTIVVPPAYGYQDFTTANNTGRQLRGEILIFDIELVSILK